ncbi:MAG: hypothetical protein ACOX9E_07950 [Lentisphaeria bacterium]
MGVFYPQIARSFFLSADYADSRRFLAACLAAARQFTPPDFYLGPILADYGTVAAGFVFFSRRREGFYPQITPIPADFWRPVLSLRGNSRRRIFIWGRFSQIVALLPPVLFFSRAGAKVVPWPHACVRQCRAACLATPPVFRGSGRQVPKTKSPRRDIHPGAVICV